MGVDVMPHEDEFYRDMLREARKQTELLDRMHKQLMVINKQVSWLDKQQQRTDNIEVTIEYDDNVMSTADIAAMIGDQIKRLAQNGIIAT